MLDPKRIAEQHLRTAAHPPDPGEDEVYLREQVALMDRLISRGEARRLGRTSDVEPEQVSFDGDRVTAQVRGSRGDTYDTRITLRPRPGHHCTCVDWGKNGLRVGPCKHVLSLGYAWRENVERKLAMLEFSRTAAQVEKTATSRHPTKLAMFDFDGTLFNSEERNPNWWTKPGQYSWGSDPRSLTPPCVPERPDGPAYWNMKVVQAARAASADPMTYVVLITGRLGVHEPRIRELLAQQGIKPDGFYFNRGGNAATFKKTVFGSLFIKLSTMQMLDIWENENQGVYGDFVRRLSHELEHDIELEVHHVSEKHVPALCSAEDFPGEMRVASTRGVGLFIPVPKHLAEQFPSLGKEDTSPPHVTLLYVGDVPAGRKGDFEEVVTRALSRESGPVMASLGEPDFFVHPGKDRRVWYSRVRFSKDVAEIRDRLWLALEEAGFEVQDSFPLAYNPHATLAYVDGEAHSHARWEGVVPQGSWSFDGVEVWGLGAKKRTVPLGTYNPPTFVEVATSRVASQWAARVGSEYRVDDETWQVVGTIHPTFEAAVVDVFERAGHPKMDPIADIPRGRTFLWHDLFVDEGERDAGLGRDIVRHVESDLRRQGVQAIVLHASDYSERPSRGFWERMGYTVWVGDDPSDPVCWKVL